MRILRITGIVLIVIGIFFLFLAANYYAVSIHPTENNTLSASDYGTIKRAQAQTNSSLMSAIVLIILGAALIATDIIIMGKN